MAAPGYLAIWAAALLWALGGVVARFVIDRGASVVELTEARAWIALLGLAVVVWVRRRVGAARTAGGDRRSGQGVERSWRGRGAIVAFGGSIAGANLFYYTSLALLPVAVAITVQYTAPGLVVLWVAAASRRLPTGRVLAALGLAVCGVALLAELPAVLAGEGAGLSSAGLLASGVAAVAFAAYIVVGDRLGRLYGPDGALLRGFAVAGAFWVAVQVARGHPDTIFDPAFLPWILFLGVFTTLAPFLLFLWGLGRVEVSRAGIVSTFEPLAAALLAYLWLGQALAPLQIVGGLMVVAGIGVVQLERPTSPEAMAERAALE